MLILSYALALNFLKTPTIRHEYKISEKIEVVLNFQIVKHDLIQNSKFGFASVQENHHQLSETARRNDPNQH